tara:strand:- start:74440 stop:75030 length:591 start_codon:yes stop_codon:yes gene_type:complete
MSLPIICPACHLKFPVESGITHAAAHTAIASAIKLPAPLGALILRYMGMFAPASRAINMDRLTTLLDELQQQINSGKVKYKNRSFVVTNEVWRAALDEILMKREKFALPLKTHGLLYDIAGQHATKHSAQCEVKTEKQRRNRTNDTPEKTIRSISDINADIRHFQNLADGMEDSAHKTNTLNTIQNLQTELERSND